MMPLVLSALSPGGLAGDRAVRSVSQPNSVVTEMRAANPRQ